MYSLKKRKKSTKFKFNLRENNTTFEFENLNHETFKYYKFVCKIGI